MTPSVVALLSMAPVSEEQPSVGNRELPDRIDMEQRKRQLGRVE
jgi:hypothetical protein